MKINFQTDIPIRERLKILWYGRIHVHVNYKGQNKNLYTEIGAVNPKVINNENKNDES